jgi:hypothetical protein
MLMSAASVARRRAPGVDACNSPASCQTKYLPLVATSGIHTPISPWWQSIWYAPAMFMSAASVARRRAPGVDACSSPASCRTKYHPPVATSGIHTPFSPWWQSIWYAPAMLMSAASVARRRAPSVDACSNPASCQTKYLPLVATSGIHTPFSPWWQSIWYAPAMFMSAASVARRRAPGVDACNSPASCRTKYHPPVATSGM